MAAVYVHLSGRDVDKALLKIHGLAGEPFGTQVATSGAFQPNNYLSHTLTFKSSDTGVAQSVGASNSSDLVLQMSADVSAGWYHELITRSDSATWTFSG